VFFVHVVRGYTVAVFLAIFTTAKLCCLLGSTGRQSQNADGVADGFRALSIKKATRLLHRIASNRTMKRGKGVLVGPGTAPLRRT
jgi:hypothetical protein